MIRKLENAKAVAESTSMPLTNNMARMLEVIGVGTIED